MGIRLNFDADVKILLNFDVGGTNVKTALVFLLVTVGSFGWRQTAPHLAGQTVGGRHNEHKNFTHIVAEKKRKTRCDLRSNSLSPPLEATVVVNMFESASASVSNVVQKWRGPVYEYHTGKVVWSHIQRGWRMAFPHGAIG